MSELVDSDGGEMLRRAEPRKDLPLGDQRPQIDDVLVAVVEFDLRYTVDDGVQPRRHRAVSSFDRHHFLVREGGGKAFEERILPRRGPSEHFAALGRWHRSRGDLQGDNIDHGAMLCNHGVEMRGRMLVRIKYDLHPIDD